MVLGQTHANGQVGLQVLVSCVRDEHLVQEHRLPRLVVSECHGATQDASTYRGCGVMAAQPREGGGHLSARQMPQGVCRATRATRATDCPSSSPESPETGLEVGGAGGVSRLHGHSGGRALTFDSLIVGKHGQKLRSISSGDGPDELVDPPGGRG